MHVPRLLQYYDQHLNSSNNFLYWVGHIKNSLCLFVRQPDNIFLRYSSGSNPSKSPKTYLYTVSERHHYVTQVNQMLALGLGSGFIHGFFFTFML